MGNSSSLRERVARRLAEENEPQKSLRERVTSRLAAQNQNAYPAQPAARAVPATDIMTEWARENAKNALMELAMETVGGNGYVSMADLNRESNGAGAGVSSAAIRAPGIGTAAPGTGGGRGTPERGPSKRTFGEELRDFWDSIKPSAVLEGQRQYQSVANQSITDDYIDPIEAAAFGAYRPALSVGEAVARSVDRDFGDAESHARMDKFGHDLDDTLKKAKETQPAAYGAGNLAGNLAVMSGIGSGVASIPGFKNLPALAKGAISGAAARGGMSFIGGIGAASGGRQEAGDFAKEVAASAIGGAVGGAAAAGANALGNSVLNRMQNQAHPLPSDSTSALTGTVSKASSVLNKAAEALNRFGLEHNTLARAAVAGVSGASFVTGEQNATRGARKLFGMEQEEQSTAEIYTERLIGFGFGVLSYLAGVYSNPRIKNAADQGTKAYQAAAEAASSGNESAYAGALAVLNNSASEIVAAVGSGVIPSAEAAEAAEIISSVVSGMAATAAAPTVPNTTGTPALPAAAQPEQKAPTLPQYQPIPQQPRNESVNESLMQLAQEMAAEQIAQTAPPAPQTAPVAAPAPRVTGEITPAAKAAAAATEGLAATPERNGGRFTKQNVPAETAKAKETEQSLPYSFDVAQTGTGYTVQITNKADGSIRTMGAYTTAEAAQDMANSLREELAQVTAAEYNNNQRTGEEATANGRTQIRNEIEKRGDRVGAGEQARSVSQRAEERRAAAVARRAAAQDLRNQIAASPESREVSAEELHIPGGSSETMLRTVPESLKTEGMRSAEADAKDRGYTVHWFSGDNVTDGGVERAAVDPETKQMWICADDSDASGEQLYEHEKYHTLPEDTRAQVAQRLVSERGAELDDLIGKYVDDYGWEAFDTDYVTEEILADAYAGIDIYAGIRDYYEGATRFTEDTRAAVESAETEASAERGPPEGSRHSAKLKGVQENGAGEARDREPGEGRSGLVDNNALGAETPEGTRGQSDSGRRGSGADQRNIGQALRYGDLTDYERDTFDQYVLVPVDEDPEWRAYFKGYSMTEVAETLYDSVIGNTPLAKALRKQIIAFERGEKKFLAFMEKQRGVTNESVANADTDNTGNTLSEGQKSYFANSKMRDDQGRLKVMYRGGRTDIDVFDRKKSSPSNLYGRGFYFTDDYDIAKRYGNPKSYYLNIEAPLSPGQNAITREQMLGFLRAVEEDEDYGLENYGYGATPESVLKSVYGKGDFEMLQDVNATAIGDFVAAIELFNEINGTEYDGIILETETVTFQSAQAKKTTNKNPTSNPSVKKSSKLKTLDADYMDAVERGDTETAQRMVDEAAKAAGYDTPKLYHGTRAFGFTQFDTNKSDDGISLFATDNPQTAETYSGKTGRTKIKDRSSFDVSSLHGDELISKARENNKRYKDYKLMSEKDREQISEEARSSIGWSIRRAQEFVRDHNGAFDTDKAFIMDRLISALYHLRDSETEGDISDAWTEWEDAIWDLKGMDDSIAIEFLDDVDSRGLFQSKNELDDMTYLGDIYADWYLGGPDYVFDNQLQLELDAAQHQGIYELYGKPGKQLVIEANGANWNQITPPEELLLSGPQRTRDIAVAAKAKGYDSILFKSLRDNGGETPYNGESNVYIFFRPDALKSADPVTYDDNGNVIPLSERFNSENNDIRYSRKLTTEDELRRENEELRQRVEYLKGQMKRTTQPTARAEDAAKVGRSLVKDYASKADAKEIADSVKDLTEYVMRSEELSWSGVKERAVDIARNIVHNADALQEGDGETYNEVRNALKRPIVISQKDAHDVSPEWGPWRNANRGKVNVSINGAGTPVDVVYAEMSERFPSLFPEDITHPADQLQRMVEVMEDLAPVYENPYSYDMAEAVEYCANDIIDRVLGKDVRQAAPTFADKAAARLAAEKARGAQKAAQAVAKEKARRDEKIAALKQHYADVRKAAGERKADSAARTKLLNIAKRLQNKKLPAVTRALLDQYIGDLDTVAKGITGKTLENIAALRDWYDDQKANNPDFISDPATEERIKRLYKKHISDMSSQEVAELTEVLLNIENEIRTANKLIDSEDRRDTYMQGVQTIDDIRASKGGKKGPIDKLILSETLSPLREMHRVTGYVDSDPLYQRTQELADGQRKMFDYQMRANKKFDRFMENKKFIDSLAGKNAKWIEITGYGEGNQPVKVQITPAMRMSLYLHSLNDQNLKHIKEGGITIPDAELYRKGNIAEAYTNGTTVKLTPSAVRSIVSGMTEQERAFAKAAHDYFNGMSRDEINAVSEKLKGYSMAQVEDYFPINTDTAFTKKDFESLKFDGTLEGMGFLKERVNAANPIMLRDMNDVLTQSINQHSKYVGLAIPVRNFNKVWGVTKSSFNDDGSRNGFESSVQKAVGQKWGKAAVDYIEKMMTDLQNAGGHTDSWDKLFGKIRSNYAQAVLTLNLSVAMKQAASYPTAAAVLGWKPLARAMGDIGKVDLDKIAKYTPLQWYRSQGYSSQELGDMAKRGMKLPAALNWVQGVDVLTTRKLWKASEYYVRQNNKALNVGSDAYYKAVADVYNRVIEETQPNYTTMQRPQLLRSDSTLLQNLAMFKTQPFQNFNILYDAYGNLEAKRAAYQNTGTEEAKAEYREAQKRAAWAAESQLVSLAVFAAMTFAWAHLRGKDDKYKDEEGNLTLGSAAGGIGKNMLSGAFGMVPFGTEVYDLLASKVFGDKYYGVDAVTPSAISDLFSNLSNASGAIWTELKGALNGESVDWNSLRLKMEPSINATSKVLGVPVENVTNLFNLVYRQTARRAAGEYAGEYAYLRLTANPEKKAAQYYDNLYAAYQKSPEQYAEILQDMLDSGDFAEDKIKTAMESRMKAAQGVSKVSDLDQRWMTPDQQVHYNDLLASVSSSNVWTSATEDQRDRLTDKMYSVSTENDAGTKIQSKIDGGADVGLSDSEYMLYLLALDMADNENRGSYTNAEVETAIKNVPDLTDEERGYLWLAQGKNAKTNPWSEGEEASTKKTESTKEEPAKSEPKKEEPKPDTADVTGSTMLSAATYDPKTETVSVTFRSNGRTYTYDGITQSDWEAFKAADSKGNYLNTHWK